MEDYVDYSDLKERAMGSYKVWNTERQMELPFDGVNNENV